MVTGMKRAQVVYRAKGELRAANVTESDILWLCRAVEAEGRRENQVAQTLVNLWAYCHSKAPRVTLTRIVRSYAQPINPRWYLTGDLHQKWHAIDPKKYPDAAAVRRENVHSRLVDFSPHVVGAVERALTVGPVDIEACCTDYAASWIDASRKYKALTGIEEGFNRLWTRAPSWTGYKPAP